MTKPGEGASMTTGEAAAYAAGEAAGYARGKGEAQGAASFAVGVMASERDSCVEKARARIAELERQLATERGATRLASWKRGEASGIARGAEAMREAAVAINVAEGHMFAADRIQALPLPEAGRAACDDPDGAGLGERGA